MDSQKRMDGIRGTVASSLQFLNEREKAKHARTVKELDGDVRDEQLRLPALAV
jgi:hypothetical protein